MRSVDTRARRGRMLLGALLSAVLLTGLVAGPAPASDAAAGPRVRPHVSQPAGGLADSLGVGVHLTYPQTPYEDLDGVIDALVDLGITHVRDDLFLDEEGRPLPAQARALGRLADAGIRSILTTGNPGEPINGNPGAHPVSAYVAALAGDPDIRRSLEGIQGTNEWDVFSPVWGEEDTWAEDLVQRHTELVDAVRGTPALADLPVLSPPLASTRYSADRLRRAVAAADASLGDLASAHFYPGGWRPTGVNWPLRSLVRTTRGLMPGAPVVVTETGYHNALRSGSGHLAVPEAVSAVYLTRLIADFRLGGVDRAYTYELFDEAPDPGRDTHEDNFGLLRADGSRKPAYRGVRALLRLLEDPGADRPGRLAYALRGADARTRQLLLRKSDGRFVLLLWRDVDIWNPQLRESVAETPARVTLRLDRRRPMRIYEPTSGCGSPVRSVRARTVRLRVDASITAVVLGGRRAGDLVRPLPACRAGSR